MIKLKQLLSELTSRQRKVKKDYLFRQSKLESSNQIPSFEEVWKGIHLNGDGFNHEMEWAREEDPDKDEATLEAEFKETQRERYEEIISLYKELEGQSCWRKMILHKSVDPRTLEQLGIYWAIKESSAEAHFGNYNKDYIWECTYEAIIELNNVDWPGTIFARMDLNGGDDENEIKFLKNAPLMVRKVEVCNRRNQGNCRRFFISNRRRA